MSDEETTQSGCAMKLLPLNKVSTRGFPIDLFHACHPIAYAVRRSFCPWFPGLPQIDLAMIRTLMEVANCLGTRID